MSPLADLQRQMAEAILGGDDEALPPLAPSPIPSHAAFQVHHDTVLGGLANALRLTFPTVEALVGETFFDQAARAFVADRPPRRANLSAYGEDFPAFIARYPPAAGLSYLADVARLDLAITRVLQQPGADVRREVILDMAVTLSLPRSLTALGLQNPADLIRDGVEANDDRALAAIDLSAQPRWLAIWRAGRTATMQLLSPPAGLFLKAILSGRPADDALAAAMAVAEPSAALEAIQAEVFAARFSQIIQTPAEDYAL